MSTQPTFRAAIAAVALIWLLATAGCESMCGNQELQRASPQSAEWTAISFNRDCGATTAVSTQVSIIHGNAALRNDPGNVLVLEKEGKVKLSVTSAGELLVELPADAKSLKQETAVNGIRVLYQ